MGYYDPPDQHEGTYPATCQGYLPEDTTKAVPEYLIDQILAVQHLIGLGSPNAQGILEQLRKEMLSMPNAVDVECGFEGKVDASFSGGRTSYTVYWTCPRCGKENEEDREAGDDHPDL
jgi:hypothetical protein